MQHSTAAAECRLSTAVHARPREVARLAADLYHLRRVWHRWQSRQCYLHPLSRRGEQLCSKGLQSLKRHISLYF